MSGMKCRAGIVGAVLFLNCATVEHFGEPPDDPVYVMAGTRANLMDLGNPRSADYCFARVDFPFSFVMDLVLLPLAIPLALTSRPQSDPDDSTENEEQEEGTDTETTKRTK